MFPRFSPRPDAPSGNLHARLLPVHGGPAIDIVQPLTVLGRRDGCDVRLPDTCVSKTHCALVWANGLLLLRDLESCNGTRVNGARVHEVVLANNDQINVAGYLFVVRLEHEADRSPSGGGPSHHLN
jgi:pSer/pThr/pTyr-binding forkhead associated (FHA) protein